MSSSLPDLLIDLSIATSTAVALVGVARRPLRRAAGAQAAYWLWLMVPGSAFAVLLPGPGRAPTLSASVLLQPISHVLARLGPVLTDRGLWMSRETIGALVWVVGAALMFAVIVRRQQAFVRSLRPLWWLPNDTYRSHAVVEPMLIGAWNPRIVLPADFERRYTREECALVLAHERAHVQRRDAVANAVAAGWLCLFWFNPLMYWAARRFRFDQELACDARVLATMGAVRRRPYAEALLKIQLSVEPIEPVPIGCHWRSGHPLRQRIAMLKDPLPGPVRRALGVAMAVALIVAGSVAIWATQPHAGPFSDERSGSHTSC